MDNLVLSARRVWSGLDLDLVEKCVLVALFSFFTYRVLGPALNGGSWLNYLALANEAALVAFVLFRRRAKDLSVRPADWFTGFLGTCLPMLVLPATGEPFAPAAVCGVLMLAGFVFQMAAKFTLRRSFGVVAANRGVKVSGPYRLVRHPMYAGYMVTQIGFLLANPATWNIAVYLAAWTLQMARIAAEERVLSQDPEYRAFCERTRYRLLPGVY